MDNIWLNFYHSGNLPLAAGAAAGALGAGASGRCFSSFVGVGGGGRMTRGGAGRALFFSASSPWNKPTLANCAYFFDRENG